jgi:transcriptional regulator with XRE-family HTH domain
VSTSDKLAIEFGRMIRKTRLALRRTQKAVGAACGLSQPEISRIEGGRRPGMSVRTMGAVCDALEILPSLELRPPFVAGAPTSAHFTPVRRQGRQRDAAHARCNAYLRRRLERLGWQVAQEVEIVVGRSHGWIDTMAFHPESATLLVGEIKTELHDIGEIQRTTAWYEREAWASAIRLGWSPRKAVSCLFVLSTEENEIRIAENREILAQAFPVRSRKMARWLQDPSSSIPLARALVLVDPLKRGRWWILGTRVDGRRTVARYADYRDFVTRIKAA